MTNFNFEVVQINSQIKNRSPLVVDPYTTVLEAIAQMREADSGYVLVMASDEIDSGSDLLGILTREDITRISLKGCTFNQLLVKDEMCSPVITIQESELTDMKSALVLFYSYQISRLPVLNGDRLVGVLTQNDLIDLLAEKVLESNSNRYKISQNPLNLQDMQVQDASCLSLLLDTYEELQLHIEELKTIEEELRLRNIDLENIQYQYQDLFDFAPDGYLVTDRLGVISSANVAICNFLAISQEQLCGKSLVMYVEPSDQTLFHNKLCGDFSDCEKLTWEMSLKRAHDYYCPVEVSVSKTRLSDNGTTLRWLVRDISDRRQAQQALQELNQSLETTIEQRTNELWQVNKLQRTILDSTEYSIITTDLNGLIQVFNHGAEQMFGYSMGEIVGQFTPEIFHDAQELVERAITVSAELDQDINGLAIFTTKASLGITSEEEWTGIRKDGSRFPLSLSISALRDEKEQIIGFLGISKDISDRKKAEALLQTTNQELLRATILKDEFLANMSHELRTPLNAILGITESLSDETFGPLQEKQKSMLKVVENSGNHLLELINDILDLAKIEANEMTLDCQSSNIKDICQSSMMFVRQMAIQKNLQLDLRGAPSELETSLDERRIRQVLINLLSNAIKFTPSGGKITLEYALSISNENSPQAWVSLAVIDTGIGITSDNLQKLFQPFIQIDSPLNRQYDGTGLGLALVKKIVELHGGYVSATSELGVGSRFAIALPYSRSMSYLPQQLANTTTSVSAEIDSDYEFPLVLLAEDNEDSVLMLSSYLEARGFRLRIARNGQEAIDLVQKESPDLILMDIQMPKMDGLEAIKYIRSNGFNKLIVAITALAMESDRENCLAAGADDYISKPIKLKLLFTTIQQLYFKKNRSENKS
ncbi:PAS domain S-box protein [Pseudanabaena galeata UHCC 0370]|uniref:histidine kinase n=1 Tax=Pseudanabaena galeata UHCC 0370 TaxID=3110310 RepID=A0ABU5TGK6_9CYAN|nr:PAS domain S-box protein [Pseudanabaena galeata UHCC 0370]